VEKLNPQLYEMEEEKKAELVLKAKNKGYYNRLYDEI
jgi:hypothetical protein